MASGYSNGSGGLITSEDAISRWLDSVERKQQREEQAESFHLYFRGDISYAELKERHPEFAEFNEKCAVAS